MHLFSTQFYSFCCFCCSTAYCFDWIFFFLISAEPALLVLNTIPGVKPPDLGMAAQRESPG